MSKLEDLIRASHRRIFSVTPPEDGWERIHAELNRPDPARPPKSLFGWGFGSGLLAGGLAVYLLLSLHSGTTPTPSTAALPCPDRPDPNGPALTAAVGAGRESATQTYLPLQVESRSSSSPRGESRVPSFNTYATAPANPGMARPAENPVSPELTDPAPALSRTVERQAAAAVVAPLSTPQRSMTDSVVSGPQPVSYLSRLPDLPPVALLSEITGLPEDKYVFQRVPQEVPITARWEVGGSVLVLPGRQRYYGYALYDEPLRPGQPGRGNPTASEPDTLYQGEVTGLTDPTRLFHFKSVYLEVGHQFPSGIRLSGGLLGIASGSRNYGNLDPVVDELRSSEVATQYITSSERRLIGTLAFQYTFFRRRRFRLSAGLGIITFLETRNTETSFIAVGDGYPSGSQSSIRSNNVPFYRTKPLPSLQLQYQIGRHLSLTGDLVPGLGIGLRYGIEAE